MPKQPTKTADDVFALVETKVIPELAEVKSVAYEARDLAKKAGLNGFGPDIHDFFEQRSEEASAKRWLSRRLRPVARFKVLAAIVGVLSTVAWLVIALREIATSVHPPG